MQPELEDDESQVTVFNQDMQVRLVTNFRELAPDDENNSLPLPIKLSQVEAYAKLVKEQAPSTTSAVIN